MSNTRSALRGSPRAKPNDMTVSVGVAAPLAAKASRICCASSLAVKAVVSISRSAQRRSGAQQLALARRCRRPPAGRAPAGGAAASRSSGARARRPRSRGTACRRRCPCSSRSFLIRADDALGVEAAGARRRCRSPAARSSPSAPAAGGARAGGRAAAAADCRRLPSRDPPASRSAVDLPAPDMPVTSRIVAGLPTWRSCAARLRLPQRAVSTLIGADGSSADRAPASGTSIAGDPSRCASLGQPRRRPHRDATSRRDRRFGRHSGIVDDADAAHLDPPGDRSRRRARPARRRVRDQQRCDRRRPASRRDRSGAAPGPTCPRPSGPRSAPRGRRSRRSRRMERFGAGRCDGGQAHPTRRRAAGERRSGRRAMRSSRDSTRDRALMRLDDRARDGEAQAANAGRTPRSPGAPSGSGGRPSRARPRARPGPSSSTRTTSMSPLARAPRSRPAPPSGEKETALSIRFSNTRSSRAPSPSTTAVAGACAIEAQPDAALAARAPRAARPARRSSRPRSTGSNVARLSCGVEPARPRRCR